MKLFELYRDEDETRISGVGIVAEGVEFYDGTVAMRWKTKFNSTVIYDNISDLESIHGHNGKTRIVWVKHN